MINGWNCLNCKIYNDILTDHCISCRADKPDWLTAELQCLAEIKRGIFIARISHYTSLTLEKENMTPQEELFSKFYNQEKILVKDMDRDQLRTHRDELSIIAFEAKARLGAIDDEARERNKSVKNKDWLITTDTTDLSRDAINAPKIRQARMSKMDKLRDQLLAAGLDEDTVKQMMRDLETKATEKDANAITFKAAKSPIPNEFKTPVQERIDEAKRIGIIEPDKNGDDDNPFAKLF